MSRVQVMLDRLVSDGSEVGVQVAAYLNGQLVVDAWAGIADRRAADWSTATRCFNVSSCGKGVAATCLHLLADRGRIDYDRSVAEYWPEFALNGKAGITVRHVLAHRSGIPHRRPGYGPQMLIHWDRMCSAIAELVPIFGPGTKTAYQAVNYGFIVGELVRRIDGRSIGQFVRQEIGKPLSVDSLFLACRSRSSPSGDDYRGRTAACTLGCAATNGHARVRSIATTSAWPQFRPAAGS